jgi:predicted transposase YdaD
MSHDQLFKDFLRAFLREFLELFYPDAGTRLNFATARFLDKELFTDFPEGSLREADVAVEVKTLDGEPELLLIHIEIEAERRKDFEARMFRYYALLWLRHRLPIFPIVVYLTSGAGGLTQEEYRSEVFGREVVRFRYECVGLGDLDAEKYAAMDNPVAAALAALMNRRRAKEPLTLRALMMQHVVQSNFDDARKFLLLNLIESYFTLNTEEKESFRNLLEQKGFQEVKEMQVTWADRMQLEGKRNALLRQLSLKFGQLPEEVKARVQAIESPEELDAYLDRILFANSLAEMGLERADTASNDGEQN